jgi:hypothetical protein
LRIAVTLAGALLGALLIVPAAAHAESVPAKPRVLQEQQFAEPNTAHIIGEPQPGDEGDESAGLTVKKRKKPQFQTRFFSE